jgi:DNA-binding transcriptional ArsR family regulator
MQQIQETKKIVDKKVIQFFSSLGDETRLKILLSLTERPRTVNEIYNYVGKERISLSAISHQLKFLSDIDMIHHKRNGQEKIFELSNDFCWCIIRDVFKHFNIDSKNFEGCCECSDKKSVKRGGGQD